MNLIRARLGVPSHRGAHSVEDTGEVWRIILGRPSARRPGDGSVSTDTEIWRALVLVAALVGTMVLLIGLALGS